MQKIFLGTIEQINDELENGWNYIGFVRVTPDQQKITVVLEKKNDLSSENSTDNVIKNVIEQQQEFKAGDIVRIIHLPKDNSSYLSIGDIGILKDSPNTYAYKLAFNNYQLFNYTKYQLFTIYGQYFDDDERSCFELITDEIPEVPIKDAIQMNNIKFEVTSELSKEFQEEFFKTGKSWISGNTKIDNLHAPMLTISNGNKLGWSYNHHTGDYKLVKLISSKKKHIHADLMLEYTKLAQECEEPWKFVECYNNTHDKWVTCVESPHWISSAKYRIKK